MPIAVERMILRSEGPDALAAAADWLSEIHPEPMLQTREARWTGYLWVSYVVDLADDGRDIRDGAVAVLVHPDGTEQAGFPFFIPYRPATASWERGGPPHAVSRHLTAAYRIELALPERGEYRLELRDGYIRGPEGGRPRDGEVLGRTRFRRL